MSKDLASTSQSTAGNVDSPEAILRERLENQTASIAVVGMGYVGMPLAHAVLEAGFKIILAPLQPYTDTLVGKWSQGTPFQCSSLPSLFPFPPAFSDRGGPLSAVSQIQPIQPGGFCY